MNRARQVIEGEYDQALYWDEFDMLEEVSSTFQKEDVKENSKVWLEGWMP